MLLKIMQLGVLQWWQLHMTHITVHIEIWFHSIWIGCTCIFTTPFYWYNCNKIILMPNQFFYTFLRMNILIPWTISKCLFKWCFAVNGRLHCVHVFSFGISCISCSRRCDRNPCVVVLSFWQMQHLHTNNVNRQNKREKNLISNAKRILTQIVQV